MFYGFEDSCFANFIGFEDSCFANFIGKSGLQFCFLHRLPRVRSLTPFLHDITAHTAPHRRW